jgi:dynactin complex subunit
MEVKEIVYESWPSSSLIMPPIRSTYKERCALGSRINKEGVEMFPCTNCAGSLRKCYVSEKEKTARCGECFKRGLKCDVRNLPVSDWAAIEREEARISRELAQTTADLHQTLARQSRLMKQQEFIKTRAKEMLKRGVESLDELDVAEAADREREEQAARRAKEAAAAHALTTGFSGVAEQVDLSAFFAPGWESLGVVGGTASTPPGS